MLKKLLTLLFSLMLVFSFASCKTTGKGIGKSLDKAAKKTGKALKKTGKKTSKELKKIRKALD